MADPPLAGKPQRVFTVRAFLLGLLGVALICGLTPYNDYALNNTFLVGNNLPIGVVMLLFLIAVLVNGPLTRFAPRWSLSAGELTLAFSMTLISCALPSSGLMRYLPGSLVGPLWVSRSNAEYLALLERLHLPHWLFPTIPGAGPRQWMNSPVITQFFGRTPPDEVPPYMAWLVPAVAWGIFLAALYGALLCMVTMVRRQWNENERLPFPLTQIYLPLIEPARPGRWFNATLGQRSFWVAFLCIFALHLWNGCSKYWPEYLPTIPVYYDQYQLFTESPWRYVDYKIKNAAVFFTVVGVTYFLSSPVAFSLWFFFIAQQFYRMYLGVTTNDPNIYGQYDQHFGGILAYTITVLYVGRAHWRLILAQAFRGPRKGEPLGRYLSYPFAFWGFLACAALMVGWLVLAGSTPVGAVVMVSLLLLLFFIIARIIAETGMVHGQLQVPINKPWTLLSGWGFSHPVPTDTFYLSSMLQTVHYDFREVVPVYASHNLKIADETIFSSHNGAIDRKSERRTGRGLIAAMALALLVGYIVSFSSTLWTEYHFAWTKDVSAQAPINGWGSVANPQWQLVEATRAYEKGNYNLRHSPAGNISFGFIFTGLIAFLRLRYAWWPLHPVGYIMVTTYPVHHLWLSIFIGWLAKTIILRFGGAKMYSNAKPFFLGLIVGESLAAGFWLTLGIILSVMNIPYRPINIMPG